MVKATDFGCGNFDVFGDHWTVDTESAATLVHAFVTSRIDYCDVLLAGAPKATTDKLHCSVF